MAGSVFTLITLYFIYFYYQYKRTVHEKKRIEVQKNNFETISKKANDIILAIDIVTGRIYNANTQASDVLGYSIDELCTKTIHDLHPKEMLDISAQTIAEVWDKKGLVYKNLPFITSKGELFDVECSAKVLNYDDKPVIIIYARDIRERLKMEREIKEQHRLISEKNENITSSITYASRIQRAVFGNEDHLKTLFPQSFVFLKPHSIVSGDFYWFYQTSDYKIVIAADCTGHGVPGAFMTLLGQTFLEEIVDNQKIYMPDKILYELNIRIVDRLNKEYSETQVSDGMDMAVLTFDHINNKVYYAGANNPLFYVRKNEDMLIKASKFAVGGQVENKLYELHEFEMIPETMYYIYSDGFQDQFGEENNRKFMSKNFRKLLHEISDLELDEQKNMLNESLEFWKGNLHQTDDILVIGIKI